MTISTQGRPTSEQTGGKREKTEEESLTDCLLSRYRLCAAGIGLGTAYSLKFKKGLIPMIAAGAVGTTADMVYGYLVECAHLTESVDNGSSSTATSTAYDVASTKEFNDQEQQRR